MNSKIAVGLSILIALFNQSNAQSGCSPCDMYGAECVVLKVTEFASSKDGEVLKFDWNNSYFANKTDCERYYEHNYGWYPFENEFVGNKGWIETKYHCVSCNLVFSDKIKKGKEKGNSNGSSSANANTAKNARECFGDKQDSYNDFLASLSKIADDIFLEKVTCNNGKVGLEFKMFDAQGNKIPVPEKNRQTIDDFYNQMKEKSKAREMNKKIQELKNAKTKKEVEELFGIINDLSKSINTNKSSTSKNENELNKKFANVDLGNNNPDAAVNSKKTTQGIEKVYADNPNGNSNNKMAEGYRIVHEDGSATYAYDTDGDLLIDTYVSHDKNGKIKNDFSVNLNSDINQSFKGENELNWRLKLEHQGLKPGDDGVASQILNENNSTLNPDLPKNYFMNGVLNNYDDANKSANDISNLSNQDLVFIHNQTESIGADLKEAHQYYNGQSTPLTKNAANLIALDLANGRDVRLFAHSEGAAISYSSIPDIQRELKSLGASDKINNLTIITLGGYAPPSNQWSSGPNIIQVENNYDLVPYLAGYSQNGSSVFTANVDVFPSTKFHEVKYYYNWIKFLSNPNMDLKGLYGTVLNSNDLLLLNK